MGTAWKNLWASYLIFRSNFNAKYGAWVNRTIVLILAAIILYAFVRAIAAGLRSRKSHSPLRTRTADPKLTRRASENLAGAIRIPTVTGDSARMKELNRFLKEKYPKTMENMDCAMLPGGSMLLRWRSELPTETLPVMFCGHLDVAPAGEGWTACEPFEGLQQNGRIYGRGAMDGKGVVIALLEAAEDLIGQGVQPRRDVYFAFGCDEETEGKRGAQVIAKTMEEQGLRFDMILDEGGTFRDRKLSGGRVYSAAYIGMGEKRRCEYRVTANCAGGSTFEPKKDTAIGALAEAICRVESAQPHHHLLPIVRNHLNTAIATFPFAKRFIIANKPLLNLLAGRVFRNDHEVGALVRSTVVPSVLDGSFPAANMLPATAGVTFSARLLPHESPEKILRHLQNLLADLPVEVELVKEGETSFITSRKMPMYKLLKTTIEENYPQLPCVPTLMAACADARHYSNLSDCILRFAPLTLGDEGGDHTHGADEFLSEQSLGLAVDFYESLMKKL